MVRSVLVTTDFSAASREAFRYAASFARRFGARLYLVHVEGRPQIYTAWQVQKEGSDEEAVLRRALGERLAELAASDPGFAGLPVEPRLARGHTAAAIEEFRRTEQADLIVIGTHGEPRVDRFRLGSFAAEVLRTARCPVLVVRSGGTARQDVEAGTPWPRHVLVAYDFLLGADAGLDLARDLGRRACAEVRVVHVVEPAGVLAAVGRAEGGEDAARLEARREALRRAAASRRDELELGFAVRSGDPAAEILTEADAFGADLIVLGQRGVRGRDRLVLGSVTDHSIHRAACPVVVAK